MKCSRLLTIFFFMIFAYSAFASHRASVAIVVGGSPCSGGPTDCRLLRTSGKVLIQRDNGVLRTVTLSNTGVTHITLIPARYKFRFVVIGPVGSSETVEQDIRKLSTGSNLVTIETDTGIR